MIEKIVISNLELSELQYEALLETLDLAKEKSFVEYAHLFPEITDRIKASALKVHVED